MFRVASECLWRVPDSARVSEDVHKSPVISSHDQRAIMRPVHSVDVGAVLTPWNDTFRRPGVLSMVGGPISALIATCSILVL